MAVTAIVMLVYVGAVATVEDEYVSETPPTVRVVFVVVSKVEAEVCLTANVSPVTAVPPLEVYDPPFLL
jgi:hypothetical protein